MAVVEGVELPQGWTYEANGYGQGFDIITTDGEQHPKYSVTIQWERRGFALGVTAMAARLQTSRKYKGRGWRQQLVTDAIAALKELEK